MLCAEQGIQGHQGEQKVCRSVGGGQRVTVRRRLSLRRGAAHWADRRDIVAIGNRQQQMRTVQTHRPEPRILGPQKLRRVRAAGQVRHDDLLALLGAGQGH